MRILTVIGARPQFIKAAVLSRLMAQMPQSQEIIVHTGQHYDERMSDIFFQELEIPPPHYHLNVGSASHGEQIGAMIRGLDQVIQKELPDLLLVYGDTTSTLAGALTALRHRLPLAHVEAGLRSFDRSMPEEHNRVATDHLSHWLFAPTPTAIENLTKEGITQGVHQVGDIMYDALLYYSRLDEHRPASILYRLALHGRPYALCTLHRAGNTEEARFRKLWHCIGQVAEQLPVVLPLHPRTKGVLDQLKLPVPPSVHLVPPVGYRDMLQLERFATVIVTDSGGVQKEAYMMGIPCITLRDSTEWVETVTAGWNSLVGDQVEKVLHALHGVLAEERPSEQRPTLYGSGQAGEEILQVLQAA